MGEDQIDAEAAGMRRPGFRGKRHIAVVFATLTALWFGSSLAAPIAGTPRCVKPDVSFNVFLSRFTDDKSFQRSRLVLPLVARFGNYLTNDASVELWSLEKIVRMSDPLIYSRGDIKRLDLVQRVVAFQLNRYAEVEQENAGDADDTRLLYRFRNLEGCWFLEEFDDRGL
jgi:hypothetical protein